MISASQNVFRMMAIHKRSKAHLLLPLVWPLSLMKNTGMSFPHFLYQPLYIISDWSEPGTMFKRLTVDVLLLSGTSFGQFSFLVSEDGNLVVFVTWPDPLENLNHSHQNGFCQTVLIISTCIIQNWLDLSILKSCTSHSTSSVQPTSRNSLQFQNQTHDLKKYSQLRGDSSAKVVYVERRAPRSRRAVWCYAG